MLLSPDAKAILVAVSVAWALAMVRVDYQTMRLPNKGHVIAMVFALMCYLITGLGPLGVTSGGGILGFAIALACTLPGYMAGQLAAGDVKFSAVLGLYSGLTAVFPFLLLAALMLGALALMSVTVAGVYAAKAKILPAGVPLGLAFSMVTIWSHFIQ